MRLITHDARQYAESLKALRPLGAAWEWELGGFGDNLTLATAQELARLDADAQLVMDEAIELHRPAKLDHTLSAYQRVADAATQLTAAGNSVNPAPVVVVSHLIPPATIGCRIGNKLWTVSCRYYLRVQFSATLINAEVLLAALNEFKQAHIFLFVENIPAI